MLQKLHNKVADNSSYCLEGQNDEKLKEASHVEHWVKCVKVKHLNVLRNSLVLKLVIPV